MTTPELPDHTEYRVWHDHRNGSLTVRTANGPVVATFGDVTRALAHAKRLNTNRAQDGGAA